MGEVVFRDSLDREDRPRSTGAGSGRGGEAPLRRALGYPARVLVGLSVLLSATAQPGPVRL
jgi:hypothetical protein